MIAIFVTLLHARWPPSYFCPKSRNSETIQSLSVSIYVYITECSSWAWKRKGKKLLAAAGAAKSRVRSQRTGNWVHAAQRAHSFCPYKL